MSKFILMGITIVDYQIVKIQKKRMINKVISFALEMMNVRSYRQLVRAFKNNCSGILGF